MIEKTVEIRTSDGTVDTFICHPERNGPHPGVIFYMDAPAIREELRDIARRIATVGYYVMLPNLYYRAGHGLELGPRASQENTPERKMEGREAGATGWLVKPFNPERLLATVSKVLK